MLGDVLSKPLPIPSEGRLQCASRLQCRGLGAGTLALALIILPIGNAESSDELIELSKDDSQWVMPAKNYASTRFSGLNQINAENVKDLKVAWTFSTGQTAGHEAAPIVVGNTMYVVTPWPNILYALDTSNGALRWSYDPGTSRASKGVACCDVVNRGAAYFDGKIFYNTLDNHTVAVDAETGDEVWKTKLGEINRGETMTMAPLVVKGRVLVGNSGGELGVRGWLTALDAETGEIDWRAYSTGPDSEVLIGDEFKPFYEMDRGPDLGVATWPPDRWRIGGGTVWGWVSYDPELDMIYYGTGNPGPWNHNQRPGDNKWTCAIFARNADSGMARWAYQWDPGDKYDYDGINELILLTLPIDDEERRVIVTPQRNGYVYVIDRETGEVLSADQFQHNTVTKEVNLKTGRHEEIEGMVPKEDQILQNICPSAPGAKDWQPSAFSPETGLLYIPHQHLCMDMKVTEANFIAGTPFVGAEVQMYAGPGGHRGEFMAWDPVQRKPAWTIREEFPVWSGALATAGDVVFYGTMDRWFKAVHAQTGELLWQYRTGSGIIGQPVTYTGPDGQQYVAILAGVGGWPGALVSANLDPEVPFGALGFVHAMTDLPDHTGPGGTLYVFALPKEMADTAQPAGAAPTPPAEPAPDQQPAQQEGELEPEQAPEAQQPAPPQAPSEPEED
jgi:lanthanide-dependent methanol dehydrogenase